MSNNKSVVELIDAEKYPHNNIYNLDPENVLPIEKRIAIRRELEPVITGIRKELHHHHKRIIFALDSAKRLYKMQWPIDDLNESGYRKLEARIEDSFIETIDLEDLIALGAPLPFIASRCRSIRANLDFTIAELDKSLERLKWSSLEESAKHSRESRLSFAEREELRKRRSA